MIFRDRASTSEQGKVNDCAVNPASLYSTMFRCFHMSFMSFEYSYFHTFESRGVSFNVLATFSDYIHDFSARILNCLVSIMFLSRMSRSIEYFDIRNVFDISFRIHHEYIRLELS